MSSTRRTGPGRTARTVDAELVVRVRELLRRCSASPSGVPRRARTRQALDVTAGQARSASARANASTRPARRTRRERRHPGRARGAGCQRSRIAFADAVDELATERVRRRTCRAGPRGPSPRRRRRTAPSRCSFGGVILPDSPGTPSAAQRLRGSIGPQVASQERRRLRRTSSSSTSRGSPVPGAVRAAAARRRGPGRRAAAARNSMQAARRSARTPASARARRARAAMTRSMRSSSCVHGFGVRK